MEDFRPSSITEKATKSRVVSVAAVFFLTAVLLLLTTASQVTITPVPTVLAASPDYDAEVRDVRTSLREVSEGDTADILIEIRNRSSLQNPYGGEATLDLHFTVRQPSGDPDYFGSDNVAFSYNQTRTLRIRNYTFDSAGTVDVEVGVYDNLGMDQNWHLAHRFTTDSGSFTVNEPEPDFDAEVERIWLSRSVKSGETADINVRVENRARRNGPHSGRGTYDILLEVTAPSGEDFTKEWNDIELSYHEDITLEWEDFLFEEVGRYRFSAEVHDIRGQQESWNTVHMFDSRSWSYSVEQGEAEWDAEVERIWVDPDVEAGERADIRVRFENNASRNGPFDGSATYDLLLEWHSPSGRKFSEQWDDEEFPPDQDLTFEVEDFTFGEAGTWRFEAGIYDVRGFEEGFPAVHMFADRTWSYTVDDAEPTWAARINNIHVSESTHAIEVDFQNLSDDGGSFDLSIKVTSPSGQIVRYAYDNQVFEYNQTRTYSLPHDFGESGPYSVSAEIFDLDGMQEDWSSSHRFDSRSRSFRITIPEDLVDLCPVVTLEGGRSPWLLQVKVDGVERDLDSRGCVKLAGDTGSGTFGEGEYLLEVVHPGYLSATLLVYLAEGDPVVDPEVKLLAGDINGDGFVGPEDLDLNRDGVITDIDATLLIGSGLADIDGDGDVLLGTDVLALARNLGRTHSPTFLACQVLYSDETPESLDDPIDWSIGGCTKGSVEEVTTWLQTFSDVADSANLVVCGIFLGNVILAIIPPTSPSAVALPVTGAACFATGVAASGLAIAEFSTRNDGENITKLLEGDPEALKEGGFILGVGALDFVGGGAFLKLGKGGLRLNGKLGVKSFKNGARVSKTYSLEPFEAPIRSKRVNRKLVSALGSEDEAAKLIKSVQGLAAAEQAGFYRAVSRAIHLQNDRKLFGLDEFLRGVKDQSGDPLVRSLRELSVAAGLAQSKRSADEIVVLGSHELKMNVRSRGNPAKIFAADKQLDAIELRGDSAAAVKAASGTGLKTTLKDGIFIEDVLKVHEITRVEFDVGVQSISDGAIWQKLNRPLTDADLKSKFFDLIRARTASNIPELNRVVFLDFLDGKKQRGIGRDTINQVVENAKDHRGRPEFIGADKLDIHFLADVTVRINNIDVPKFVPHILTIGAEGTAVTLRQVWNAGVLSADEIGAYNASEFPIELIHGEGPWTEQQSSDNGTGSGGGSQTGSQTPPGETGSGVGSGSGGGSTPSSPEPPTSNQCRHEITPDSSVNDQWTASCQSSQSDRGYAEFYELTLASDSNVTFDLQSEEDPFMYVRQDDATSGPALYKNDDIGNGDRNSRVEARLPAGKVTIEVTTYNRGVAGEFTLSVTTEGGSPRDSAVTGCAPVALTPPAVDVAGTWTADCESSVPGRGYTQYYELTLESETEAIIDLESDEDPVLHVRRGDATEGPSLHHNDDRGDGTRNSRVVATLPAGQITIEATTYAEATTGSFTLSVSVNGGAQTPVAAGCSPTSLSLPASGVSGSWTDDCQSSVSGRGYARYYSFTLADDGEATIGLTSGVDTYLYLREESATSGTSLHDNDDIESGNTNSQIVADLDAGTYTIEATTYAEATTGSFTLSGSVGGGAQTSVATGCTPASLSLPASGVSGSWIDDCDSSVPDRGYARYYSLTLAEDADVTIDLEAGVDTYLYLRQGNATTGAALHENDDVESGNTNSRIVATLPAGTYTIEVTTYSVATSGSFTLDISTGAGGGGGTTVAGAQGCNPAALTLPTSGVTGSWASNCESSVSGRGYARYYSLTLVEDGEVTIGLESSVDTYLYLRRGDATTGAALHENDDVVRGNTDSQIVATLSAGTYTIEATTYSEGAAGSYILRVVTDSS